MSFDGLEGFPDIAGSIKDALEGLFDGGSLGEGSLGEGSLGDLDFDFDFGGSLGGSLGNEVETEQ